VILCHSSEWQILQYDSTSGGEMTQEKASQAEYGQPSELVRRIMAGEAGAEDELVERYGRGILIVLRRMVRNPCTAKDLCQDALRLIVEKVRRGDVREPEKLSGFICSLARNIAKDYLRRMPRGVSLEDAETSSISDSSPDQLSHVLQEERANAIRQVLYRFYLAEEDKEKICADLALSALHFNRVLHRARERFRKLYQKTRL
jgi:RNA polymerase sigma-70 factor (ECF subfamily)